MNQAHDYSHTFKQDCHHYSYVLHRDSGSIVGTGKTNGTSIRRLSILLEAECRLALSLSTIIIRARQTTDRKAVTQVSVICSHGSEFESSLGSVCLCFRCLIVIGPSVSMYSSLKANEWTLRLNKGPISLVSVGHCGVHSPRLL